MYCDEFKINMRNEKPYTWSKIGRRGYVKHWVDETNLSFIIAFSADKIYGIRSNDSTNNSKDFLCFLDDIHHIKNDLFKDSWESSVIVWDNASIHKTEEIKRYLKANKILMVTTCPYMPWLNAAEKLIGLI